jgi:drug/metabolite transporter (DMT)-like permease
MTRQAATAIGFTAVLMWALLALLSVASGNVPPFQMSAITFLLGGLVGAATWPFRPGAVLALKQDWRVWALGVGGLFFYHAVYFMAIKRAPAVEVSLLAYLWPLLIVVFSSFLPGEKLRSHHVAGVVLGLAGAALVITRGNVSGLAASFGIGHALALACAVIWAAYSVLSRRFAKVPSDAVAGFCLVTAVLSVVCHLLFETTQWPQATSEWLAIAALGILPLGAGFYTWDLGVKQGDIMVLGALSYAAPILSTLVLLGFGMTESHWSIFAACGLVVGGAVLAAKDMLVGNKA